MKNVFFYLLLANQDRAVATPSLCHGCQKPWSKVLCCGGGRLSQLHVSGKNICLPTLVFDSCVFIHASVVWGFIASFFTYTAPNLPWKQATLFSASCVGWPVAGACLSEGAEGLRGHMPHRPGGALGSEPGARLTHHCGPLFPHPPPVRPSRAWRRRETRLLSCPARTPSRRGQCLCPSERPRVRAGLRHVWPSQSLGSEGPAMGFSAFSHRLETLNRFIFARVFCK